jgi:osmotically inducible protein OsmC
VSIRVIRNAEASWQGTVPDGGGRIALGSGAFEGSFTLRARVEDVERATNPEELIGAGQAGCFTMSLASLLSEAGHPPDDLRTTARVRLEPLDRKSVV